MEWIDAMKGALERVESELESTVTAGEIADSCGYSPFYMQRIFTMLTGMTLGEYLRERRLSEAAVRLQKGESVLDTALRYGWDSPESFARAFRKFHGCAPLDAKMNRAQTRYVTPLRLQIQLTGGKSMQYAIENRPEMAVVGLPRRFEYDDSFERIPRYWDEYAERGLNAIVPGRFGVCFDEGGDDFEYWIGDLRAADAPVPPGMHKRVIPAATWANFTAIGPIPKALQRLNREIYTDWLPSNAEWRPSHGMNIEWYSCGDMQAQEYRSGILIPVERKR